MKPYKDMKPYKITFYLVCDFRTTEPLIEYRKLFLDDESARDWAVLTAETHSTYKNFEMHIRVQEVTDSMTIYYNGQE
jgi:hypothetical protein